MALCEFGKLRACDLGDAALVNAAFWQMPVADELPQPLGDFWIVVIIVVHWIDFLPVLIFERVMRKWRP